MGDGPTTGELKVRQPGPCRDKVESELLQELSNYGAVIEFKIDPRCLAEREVRTECELNDSFGCRGVTGSQNPQEIEILLVFWSNTGLKNSGKLVLLGSIATSLELSD